MPPQLRYERERSLEVSQARLSPKFGCGLMLKELPKFDGCDPLLSVMENYGYRSIAADRQARRIIENPGLLKAFYENAFNNKTPMRRNFALTYGQQEAILVFDPKAKHIWFVAEPANRMALVNYFRDSVSLGLKTAGVLLTGATVRLTQTGWQNLHDLLSDVFLQRHPELKRVEVLGVLTGVRWRHPHLGLAITFLNLRELAQIREAVEAALRGVTGGDVES